MDSKNNIDEYYSLIDKNIINDLCKNESLKNLIKLSSQTDIYIFNKINKRWQIKSKTKLLKECAQVKKKEIKTSTSLLSNLAKLNDIVSLDNVKNIYKNLENKIDKIDKIVNCITNIDLNITPKKNEDDKLKAIINNTFDENYNLDESQINPIFISEENNNINFIEYYSNC
jgi:hypothetical protein